MRPQHLEGGAIPDPRRPVQDESSALAGKGKPQKAATSALAGVPPAEAPASKWDTEQRRELMKAILASLAQTAGSTGQGRPEVGQTKSAEDGT